MLKFTNYEVVLCLKYDFNLANSEDADEIQHYAAFHLGLHCLPKWVMGYQYTKG